MIESMTDFNPNRRPTSQEMTDIFSGMYIFWYVYINLSKGREELLRLKNGLEKIEPCEEKENLLTCINY